MPSERASRGHSRSHRSERPARATSTATRRSAGSAGRSSSAIGLTGSAIGPSHPGAAPHPRRRIDTIPKARADTRAMLRARKAPTRPADARSPPSGPRKIRISVAGDGGENRAGLFAQFFREPDFRRLSAQAPAIQEGSPVEPDQIVVGRAGAHHLDAIVGTPSPRAPAAAVVGARLHRAVGARRENGDEIAGGDRRQRSAPGRGNRRIRTPVRRRRRSPARRRRRARRPGGSRGAPRRGSPDQVVHAGVDDDERLRRAVASGRRPG